MKNIKNKKFNSFAKDYLVRLNNVFDDQILEQIEKLSNDLKIFGSRRRIYLYVEMR